MTWLVTGGAGYIGGHVTAALLAAGERVVVLDDLSTGAPQRVPAGVPFLLGDAGDPATVRDALHHHEVSGVMHLAGSKSVPSRSNGRNGTAAKMSRSSRTSSTPWPRPA